MDLIIDCIPYNGFDDKLYEMLEDDMKTFANFNCSASNSLSSSSSSPSCLSDEEQLAALSNRTNLIDEFLLFSSPPPLPLPPPSIHATNHQTYTQGMNVLQSNHSSHASNSDVCGAGSTNVSNSNNVIITSDFKSENNVNACNNQHHHHHQQQQQHQAQQHNFQQPKFNNRQIFNMHNDYSSDIISDGSFDSIYSMNATPRVASHNQNHHYHASNLSPSSCSSSSSSSPSISNASSLAPSPLSLSSSSSSLCIALANTSFNHSSPTSSQSSSACSSNISSPICLSPSNQFNTNGNGNGNGHGNGHVNVNNNDINYADFQQSNQSKLKHHLVEDQKPYFNYYLSDNNNNANSNLNINDTKLTSPSNENNQLNKINENQNDANGNVINTYANNEITATTTTATATSTKNYNRYENETNNSNNNNNSYNLYTAINPMDINRNYMNKIGDNLTDSATTPKTINQQQQQSHLNVHISTSRPINTNALTLTKTNRGLEKVSNVLITTSDHQITKRGKFDHNQNAIFSTVKKEPSVSNNSDCESFNSNESDSNSSTMSNGYNTAGTAILDQQNNSKKIFLTKLDQIGFNNNNNSNTSNNTSISYNSNHVNNNTQLNIIKIASNTAAAQTTTSAKTIRKDGQDGILSANSNIRFTIATQPKLNTDNSTGKTIIQYKQIINPSVSGATGTTSNINSIATNANSNTTVKQKNKISNNLQNSSTKNANSNSNTNSSCANTNGQQPVLRNDGKAYPKPPYSYSCLIAMALRNSDSGTLPVSDIYEFIVENFPYYKTARDGWKNSIRHNLSLNKCFEKIENPTNGSKKGCLWALNPDKCKKLEEECKRCRQRDPVNIRLSMSRPDDLNKIERGEQRIKKYTSQRKLTENCAAYAAGTQSGDCSSGLSSSSSNGKSSTSFAANATSHISIVPTANVNNGQIPMNTETNKKNDSNYGIIDWDNKDSLSILKEEVNDNYYDELGNGDINFDPILLPTVSPSVIRTNV